MASTITPPKAEEILSPLLASLPAASISPSPPTALLPLLSPILRQRVQLLSSSSTSSTEPWLPLLCYDSAKASKLTQLVKNERFEPHPVSGEVEIDWETEIQLSYKRLDEETLQSRITLADLGLLVQLIWCINDELGGGDGWRIGEVAIYEPSLPPWGNISISLAEETFLTTTTSQQTTPHPTLISHNRLNGTNSLLTPESERQDTQDDEDDDDSYWAQYDNTPARTPIPKHQSPAPPSFLTTASKDLQAHTDADDEDEDLYYAQYSQVQPALDNHDPDEALQNEDLNIESTLGSSEPSHHLSKTTMMINSSASSSSSSPHYENIHHPRPSSSHSSQTSSTIATLELKAEIASQSPVHESSEVGIRQHISTSIKSLYRLARVAGIERGEFERIVGREVEVLGMLDHDE